MFDYVGLFSAAIRPHEGAVSPVYSDFETKLKKQFEMKPALYYIAIGDKDFLYDANKQYRALLDKELSLLAWSVRRSVITKLQKFNNLSKLRI